MCFQYLLGLTEIRSKTFSFKTRNVGLFPTNLILVNKWLVPYHVNLWNRIISGIKYKKLSNSEYCIKRLKNFWPHKLKDKTVTVSLSTEKQIRFLEGTFIHISCHESRLWFHIKTKGCKMSVSKHPACMKYLYITLWALRNVVWLAFTSLFLHPLFSVYEISSDHGWT